jgi:hypothetical protein
MQSGVPITERAFQIANSGSVSTVSDLKRALTREATQQPRSKGAPPTGSFSL